MMARQILSGRRVRLDADPTQGDRDGFGRLLRYAYREDGLFFNKWMIEQGYAHEYTYDAPYQFQEEFQEAERTAREANRGLWDEGACPNTPPGSTPSSAPPAWPGDGHTWYASSYRTARFYYCDTDPGWSALDPAYRIAFPSEAAALARFPSYSLHAPCG